jgi:hypothetical protein
VRGRPPKLRSDLGVTAPNDGPSGADKAGFAGVGIAALALACCGGLPLLFGLVGGLTLGALFGVGVGALLLIAVVGMLVVMRARRRRACRVEASASAPSDSGGRRGDGST